MQFHKNSLSSGKLCFSASKLAAKWNIWTLCVSVEWLCVCLELISGWLHTNRCIVNSVLPVWPHGVRKTKRKPVTPPIDRDADTRPFVRHTNRAVQWMKNQPFHSWWTPTWGEFRAMARFQRREQNRDFKHKIELFKVCLPTCLDPEI